MEENRNRTTLAKSMTLPPLLIKDKQIAGTQSLHKYTIPILLNELAPTPPNSPTMKGFLQTAMENSIDQSKVEELERKVENLKAKHASLENEALRYHFSNRRLKNENEWMKAHLEAADKLRTEKDAELRDLGRKRQRLEYNLRNWLGLP